MPISKFLNPQNDIAFKCIFGSERHKSILIHFINDILRLTGKDKIQTVKFLSTIQDPDIAIKKQSAVDVLCKDENGTQIIVEMQIAPQKGFKKRAQYYASKAYVRQLNKGKEKDGRYANLKAVIFIAITDHILFPHKKSYRSDHIILDKATGEHDLQDLNFTFLELTKFKKTKIEDLSNMLEKWCYFFKHAEDTSESELEKIVGSDLVIKNAYEALNRFNWTEEELRSYDQEEKRIMDNLAAEDYLIDKGIEIGKEKGANAALEKTAMNMLNQKLDDSLISSVTGLSVDEILKLKSKL